MRSLRLIGAATSAGSYGRGQERTPHVLREHGLVDVLSAGLDVTDCGDVAAAMHLPEDPDRPRLRNVTGIAEVNRAVAAAVEDALGAGADAMVIGGDCTVEVGIVAGARRVAERVGVFYIDYDCDLNTPLTTGDGAGDWMGVAHLLGIEGTDPRMAEVPGSPYPILGPDDVFLVAADNVTQAEAAVIERLGIRRWGIERLRADRSGFSAAAREWAADKDVICVHVDMDVLDQTLFPIAENDRDDPALRFEELEGLLAELCGLSQSRTLGICEINPEHVDSAERLDQVIGMLARVVD